MCKQVTHKHVISNPVLPIINGAAPCGLHNAMTNRGCTSEQRPFPQQARVHMQRHNRPNMRQVTFMQRFRNAANQLSPRSTQTDSQFIHLDGDGEGQRDTLGLLEAHRPSNKKSGVCPRPAGANGSALQERRRLAQA